MSLQDHLADETIVELTKQDKEARMKELYAKVIARPLGEYCDEAQADVEEYYRLRSELKRV